MDQCGLIVRQAQFGKTVVDRPTQLICISDKRHSRAICCKTVTLPKSNPCVSSNLGRLRMRPKKNIHMIFEKTHMIFCAHTKPVVALREAEESHILCHRQAARWCMPACVYPLTRIPNSSVRPSVTKMYHKKAGLPRTVVPRVPLVQRA